MHRTSSITQSQASVTILVAALRLSQPLPTSRSTARYRPPCKTPWPPRRKRQGSCWQTRLLHSRRCLTCSSSSKRDRSGSFLCVCACCACCASSEACAVLLSSLLCKLCLCNLLCLLQLLRLLCLLCLLRLQIWCAICCCACCMCSTLATAACTCHSAQSAVLAVHSKLDVL